MERFFGGNPALVLVRLAILSLIVGVVLAALGFSPLELIDSLARLDRGARRLAQPRGLVSAPKNLQDLLRRPADRGLVPTHHDRALDEDRVVHHQLDQSVVRERALL